MTRESGQCPCQDKEKNNTNSTVIPLRIDLPSWSINKEAELVKMEKFHFWLKTSDEEKKV